jgi:IclR family transcriptional regulator, KDG regulon repressor
MPTQKSVKGSPPGRPENGSFGVSLRRGLEILELLRTSEQPLRVSEIVRSLAIPRSSAYEIIRILEQSDYINRSRDGTTYTLGRQLHVLGMAHREGVDLLKEGALVAESLRDQTGDTVQLCVMDNDYLLILLKEDGKQPVRIISKVGTRVPVNWGASGRLLVSDMSDEELTQLLLRTAKPSPISRKPVNIPALIRQIRKFRARGWAFELNETNAHVGCVAAPVLDASDRCIATLSIVAPEHRLKDELLPPLVKAAQAAAEELSFKLGMNGKRATDANQLGYPPSEDSGYRGA